MTEQKNDDYIELNDNMSAEHVIEEMPEYDEEEHIYKKLASSRKDRRNKKMRRVKQDLYDYFEQKSLREKDFYYD